MNAPPPIYLAGGVDWMTTQTLYHGLAERGEEAVVLCWPTSPYVSLGCHEPYEDFRSGSGLAVMRRQVGGSLVYLDQRQVFYHVILSLARPGGPRSPEGWYRLALGPVVHYLRDLGWQAELRLPADILVDGLKISGNAGGQLGESIVVVGNLLLDFSPQEMAEARALPHPAMRSLFAESMGRHLTTLRARRPDISGQEVMRGLAAAFREDWGSKTAPIPWSRWREALAQAARKLTDPEWLLATRAGAGLGPVKVREGVYLQAVRRPDGLWIAEIDTGRSAVLRAWRTTPGLSEVLVDDEKAAWLLTPAGG
ncbi:MAG: ligase [Thermaerobacter sp.]|nr:ligase [Thermaerobacter sp.]